MKHRLKRLPSSWTLNRVATWLAIIATVAGLAGTIWAFASNAQKQKDEMREINRRLTAVEKRLPSR